MGEYQWGEAVVGVACLVVSAMVSWPGGRWSPRLLSLFVLAVGLSHLWAFVASGWGESAAVLSRWLAGGVVVAMLAQCVPQWPAPGDMAASGERAGSWAAEECMDVAGPWEPTPLVRPAREQREEVAGIRESLAKARGLGHADTG